MFGSQKYIDLYASAFKAKSVPIQILVNTGDAFDTHDSKAIVTKYVESDLIEGGTIQLGDLKLLMEHSELERLGITKLGLKDRVVVDGRNYAVVHFDEYTRSMGAVKLAVELAARGGGSA